MGRCAGISNRELKAATTTTTGSLGVPVSISNRELKDTWSLRRRSAKRRTPCISNRELKGLLVHNLDPRVWVDRASQIEN